MAKDNTPIVVALISSVSTLLTTFMTVVLPKILVIEQRPAAPQMVQVEQLQAAPGVKSLQHVQASAPSWWDSIVAWFASLAPSSSNITGEVLISVAAVVVITGIAWGVHWYTKHRKPTKK